MTDKAAEAVTVEYALRQIIEADDKHELTQQLIEIGRAALKAQPAPTEAQGEPYAWSYECRQPFTDPVIWTEFICRDKPTKNDPKWTRNVKPLFEHAASLLVQGEDSARLDWIDANEADLMRAFYPMKYIVKVGWREVGEGASVREAIDRARASAETGGVKS